MKPVTRSLAIVAIAWVILLAYAWPGIMSIDCFDQLREGRAGFYTDGHPPVIAVLWRYLDKIHSGPAAMYVLQSTAWMVGLYGFLRRVFPRAESNPEWLTVAVAFFPPILAVMGPVWKDAQMAAWLMLGIAGLSQVDRRWKLAGLAAVWMASAVRYNAAAATLAPVVLAFEWRTGQRWFVRYGISVAVWIAITASSMWVNKALTDREMHFWSSSIEVHDIAGTLARVDDMPDDELRKLFAGTQLLVDHDIHAALRARYDAHDYSRLVLGEGRLWDLPVMGDVPAPAAQREAIDRVWRDVITSHPGAYLAHRFAVYATVIGVSSHHGVFVQTGRGQNRLYAVPLGIDNRPYELQNDVQRVIEKIAKWTPLFRAVFYLPFLLVIAWLGRRNRAVIALVLSGLLCELSLFPFAAAADFRYSHWLVVCTVLAGLVVYRTRRVAATTKQTSESQAKIQ